MATKTNNKTNGKKFYRVREYLVCRISDEKTFLSGEQLELTEEEYQAHKLVLETEEQYQSRQTGEEKEITTT